MKDPRDLERHFDHHDPEFSRDAQHGWKHLREHCPVSHSDAHGGFWVVTRYADLHQIYFDPETFSIANVTIPTSGHGERKFPLTGMDPPEHTKYRKLVQPWFGKDQVAELEPAMRARCRELIDGFIGKGQCDLFWDFARQLPSAIVAGLMGIPEQDQERFEDWAHRITETTASDPESASRAYDELCEYFGALLASRRAEPRDDLPTLLVQARIDGEPLGEEQLLMLCIVIEMAGFDTTSTFIGTSLWHLAQHPDQRQRLIDDPSLIPGAVEELLRYLAPASSARITTREVEVGGHKLGRGEQLLVVTPAANRDPEQFPNPEELDFERRPNRHFGFGAGVHRCLGMHLARREAEIALEELLPRIPDFAIAPGAEVTWSTGQIWGVRSLPVVFTRGSSSC